MNNTLQKTILLQELSLSEKASAFIIYILRLAALTLVIKAGLDGSWQQVPVLLFWLLLTYTPNVAGKSKSTRVPLQFEAIVAAFMFAALFLGEYYNLYGLYLWWDSALHFAGSMIMTYVAFVILSKTESDHMLIGNPLLFAFACFSMSLAGGVIWEIYEFFADKLFGWNMQPGGNDDTMWDMIFNVLGSVLIAALVYLHRLPSFSFSLQDGLDRFIDENDSRL